MSHRQASELFVIGNVMVCILWTVVMARSGHTEACLTQVVRDWGRSYPIITLVVGGLLVHFWPF